MNRNLDMLIIWISSEVCSTRNLHPTGTLKVLLIIDWINLITKSRYESFAYYLSPVTSDIRFLVKLISQWNNMA